MGKKQALSIVYNEKEQPRRDKRSISLLAALSLAFNFGLFSPLDFFLNNISELGISYKMVMLACLPVMALIFIAVYLVLLLTKGKAHIISLAIVTGLDLAFYIQGNYMTKGMQTLDGTAYYVHPVRAVLDVLLWVVIIALPFIIYKRKQESFKFFIMIISGAIIIIEMIAVIYTTVNLMTERTFRLKNYFEGSDMYPYDLQNEFTYSSGKNLIIIIPDEFDSFCFDKAVEEVPDSISGFGGFTYYNNTIGMYQYTIEGVTNIFTGKEYNKEKSRDDNYSNDCFFDHIPEDYSVEFYTDSVCFPTGVKKKYADNYSVKELTIKDVFCTSLALYDMALFRTVPDVMKRPFWMYTGDLTNMMISGKAYIADNLAFLHSIPSKMEFTDKPCVKVIYLHGLHNPRSLNRDLDRISNYEVDPQETAIAVNKILSSYFEALRRDGIYDSSDIVVLADHGHRPNYDAKYPFLMIKRAGESGTELKTSSAPISYADIFPTLCYLIGDSSVEGRIVFDIPENEKRERYFSALGETTSEDVDRSLPLIIGKGLMDKEVVD